MESMFVTRFGISPISVVLGDKPFLLLSALLDVGLAGPQSCGSTMRARRWSLLGSQRGNDDDGPGARFGRLGGLNRLRGVRLLSRVRVWVTGSV
jgi:hypothetical protein